jgi:hypothetical protein
MNYEVNKCTDASTLNSYSRGVFLAINVIGSVQSVNIFIKLLSNIMQGHYK